MRHFLHHRITLIFFLFGYFGAIAADTPLEPIALDALVQDAIRSNSALHEGRFEVETANHEAQVARGTFNPVLGLNASIERDQGAQNPGDSFRTVETKNYGGSLTGTLPFSTRYALSYNSQGFNYVPTYIMSGLPYWSGWTATLTQPLLRGFGDHASAPLELAQASVQASSARNERTLETTIATIETAYWVLTEAEGVESIMKERIDAAEDLLKRSRELLKRGLSSRLSVVIAEQALIERRSGLLRATNDRLRAAEDLLSLVYGANYVAHLKNGLPLIKTIASQSREMPAIFDEKAIESALERRKDLFALKAGLNAAKIKNSNLKNGLLPDLSLTVSGTKGGAPGFSADNSANTSWFAGLSLSFPLGNDSAEGNYHQSVVALDRGTFLVAEGAERVRHEIYSSFRAISSARARLENVLEAEVKAKERYEGEKKLFDLGTIDTFRLLQVQDSVSAIRINIASARAELASTTTRYHLSIGQIR